MQWALLFVGGGIGAVLRFALASAISDAVGARTAIPFPWGTFGVNVAGCFGIGLLFVLADEFGWFSASTRLFLMVGLLGGFTTFSTFGLETWHLLEAGRLPAALAYALGSTVVGVAALALGAGIARNLG